MKLTYTHVAFTGETALSSQCFLTQVVNYVKQKAMYGPLLQRSSGFLGVELAKVSKEEN